MSSRDRKARTSPMYPKSPIERPARAAVPSRSRSDPSHIHDTSSPPQTSTSNSDPFPSIPIVSTPPPQETLAPPNLRTSSLFTTRSASSSISHAASSSLSINSQADLDRETLLSRLSASNTQLEGAFSELSDLSSAFVKTAEELQDLRDSYDGLRHDFMNQRETCDTLRGALQFKESQERDDKTRINSLLLERESLRTRLDSSLAASEDRAEEIDLLRTQIHDLKRWVSSSGRSSGQVSDSTIRTSVSDLSAGLQNWVLKHFRRAKLHPASSLPDDVKGALDELAPNWQELIEAGTAKVHLIQSLASRLLVTRVFGGYFIGLPYSQEAQLLQFETCLRETAKDEADINQWRAATLGALNKQSLLTAFSARTDEVVTTLAKEITDLLNSLTVTSSPSITALPSLHTLIHEAITLSRLLRIQKPSFTLSMPSIHPHELTYFDAEKMEDVGGEEEDALRGREVLCVVFPGVVKVGDEEGERSELRNVICRAKVVCVGEGDGD